MTYAQRKTLAYIVGVALGDGNLSNPNGRAIRLRITCDAQYTKLSEEIIRALKIILPHNKVSIIRRRETFFDISVYSNTLSSLLPWKAGKGSKIQQNVKVPAWIFSRPIFIRECLRGLIQTDGCIYVDRGYKMVNFTNSCKPLIKDVVRMLSVLGYSHSVGTASKDRRIKYTVRVARDAEQFCKELQLGKT